MYLAVELTDTCDFFIIIIFLDFVILLLWRIVTFEFY